MAVRAPLDVDLEDKLVFGLSPLRFGYVVIAGLTAMATWGQRWAPPPIRLVACLPVLALGAALAWMRWRGRGFDQWIVDFAVYAWSNYAIEMKWRPRLRRRAKRRPKSQIGRMTAFEFEGTSALINALASPGLEERPP